MTTVSFYANEQELFDFSNILKCKYDEVGKILKLCLKGETNHRKYLPFFEDKVLEKNIEFDLDAWLKSTPLGEIVNRKSKAESRPVFTADPNKVQ